MKKQTRLDLAFMAWTLSLIIILFISISSCKAENDACLSKRVKIDLRDGRTIELPIMGRAVVESHWVSTADLFTRGVYPVHEEHRIDEHLKMSCNILGKSDCSDVYNAPFKRKWTPPEGGGWWGQGSRGFYRPSIEQETWGATLNMKKNFAPNTRLLVHYGNRSLVVSVGHEIGPASSKYVMGMSSESHWYLGTNNESFIELEYPINQDLPLGPIKCRK